MDSTLEHTASYEAFLYIKMSPFRNIITVTDSNVNLQVTLINASKQKTTYHEQKLKGYTISSTELTGEIDRYCCECGLINMRKEI